MSLEYMAKSRPIYHLFVACPCTCTNTRDVKLHNISYQRHGQIPSHPAGQAVCDTNDKFDPESIPRCVRDGNDGG